MIYRFNSEAGVLSYQWQDDLCQRVWFGDKGGESGHDDPVSQWLAAYFSGELLALPSLIASFSPFQQRLRSVLLTIPAGEVITYGELAAQLQSAPRAVGQALGANPLPILIPCHRVVAANGPGGFAGGAEWKARLLAFEQQHYGR